MKTLTKRNVTIPSIFAVMIKLAPTMTLDVVVAVMVEFAFFGQSDRTRLMVGG